MIWVARLYKQYFEMARKGMLISQYSMKKEHASLVSLSRVSQNISNGK